MIDQMLGSEANDCYYYDENGDVKTSSNHNGGITGEWSTECSGSIQ